MVKYLSANKNYKHSWYRTVFEPVEFMEANLVDFQYPLHIHDQFAIGLIERGAQRFVTKSESIAMPENNLCVVDPGVVHEGWPETSDGFRYRMFYPSPMVVARALGIKTSDAEVLAFGCHVIDDRSLYGRFSRLHRIALSKDDLLHVETQTIGFLRILFGRHAKARPSSEKPCSQTASYVQQYLDGNITEKVRIADLAEVSGVSETQVIRSFTMLKGLSPYAYLVAKRVEKAKQLIASGQNLTETALDCGFYDQSHLNLYFKRIVGVTPGRFAQGVDSSLKHAAM